MAIKEILLPLVGEPSSAALRAIDKCIAVAGGLGARIIAIAVEEEIPLRPKVVISADIENAEAIAATEASRYAAEQEDKRKECTVDVSCAPCQEAQDAACMQGTCSGVPK